MNEFDSAEPTRPNIIIHMLCNGAEREASLMLGSLSHPPFLSPPATLCVVTFLITHSLSLTQLFMEGTTILLLEDSFFLSPN